MRRAEISEAKFLELFLRMNVFVLICTIDLELSYIDIKIEAS